MAQAAAEEPDWASDGGGSVGNDPAGAAGAAQPKPGDRVECRFVGSGWEAGIVTRVQPPSFWVRYDGFANEYEDPVNMITGAWRQAVGEAAGPARAHAAQSQPAACAATQAAVYTVHRILKKRAVGKGPGKATEYRVRWEGYGKNSDTWEPEQNLSGARHKIEEFEKQQQARAAKRAAAKRQPGLEEVQQRVIETLRPLMVRHTKKDLALPEPVTMMPFDGVLEKSAREHCSAKLHSGLPINDACKHFWPPLMLKCVPHSSFSMGWDRFRPIPQELGVDRPPQDLSCKLLKTKGSALEFGDTSCKCKTCVFQHCLCWEQFGEREFVERTALHAAKHILGTIQPLRIEFKKDTKGKTRRQPKAVVFSEFQNDLDMVASALIGEVGEERVARHWGDYRSSALSGFRNGAYSFRVCPRCNYKNTSEVKNDSCDRRLVEVLLEPHDHWIGHELDVDSQRQRLWPVETERLWVRRPYGEVDDGHSWRDSHGRAWRRFEPGSDFRKALHQRSTEEQWVWVDLSPQAAGAEQCSLPVPEWPKDNDDVEEDQPPAGPYGNCLPGKLKGWAKCGSWRGPPRPKSAKEQTSSTERYYGCPLPWSARGVLYSEEGEPILRDARDQVAKKDTDLLMLCADGSHGLDLSFVTHIFMVNERQRKE